MQGKFTENRIAAVVVLYNSQCDVISNISSYVDQVTKLYVVDNSDVYNEVLLSCLLSIPKVTYINNNGNKGVANALNVGATMAIKEGFDFLLTMDDDTSMPKNAITDMLSLTSNYHNIGIIGGQSDPNKVSDSISIVDFTITSGNLLSLKAYQECGPFLESLFIDFVDHEYCFRLAKKGYGIIEINSIKLIHNLGNKKELSIIKGKYRIKWTSHSPSRIYYKTRNFIYILTVYKHLSLRIRMYFYKDLFRDVIKAILLEDNKLKRIKLITKALSDSQSNSLGKLKDQ